MPVYKDSKRGTWYVVMRYTNWQGKRVQTTKRGFQTKREAKEYEAEAGKKLSEKPDMTVESLCDLYIDDLKANRRPSTVRIEKGIIDKYIRPTLGSMPIASVSVNTIRHWQNTINGKSLSPATVKNINMTLSMTLNFAVKYHGLEKNPMHVTGSSGGMVSRIDFWEKEEFDKFLSVLPDENDRLYFNVLFTSGMRIGEFLALTPSDIDLDRNTVSITKTYSVRNHSSGPAKTVDSKRTITLPQYVIDDIKTYLGKFYEEPDRIFETISEDYIRYRMKKYAKLAGVKQIRIHDLRHSHASFLLHSGVPITAVSKRLGHKNPSITLAVYSHVYDSSDAEIANIFDKCCQNVVTQNDK